MIEYSSSYISIIVTLLIFFIYLLSRWPWLEIVSKIYIELIHSYAYYSMHNEYDAPVCQYSSCTIHTCVYIYVICVRACVRTCVCVLVCICVLWLLALWLWLWLLTSIWVKIIYSRARDRAREWELGESQCINEWVDKLGGVSIYVYVGG